MEANHPALVDEGRLGSDDREKVLESLSVCLRNLMMREILPVLNGLWLILVGYRLLIWTVRSKNDSVSDRMATLCRLRLKRY